MKETSAWRAALRRAQSADKNRAGPKGEIRQEIEEASEEIDVVLMNAADVIPYWSVALNPERRNQFIFLVTDMLAKAMKVRDVADEAAELWNSLE